MPAVAASSDTGCLLLDLVKLPVALLRSTTSERKRKAVRQAAESCRTLATEPAL